MFNLFIKKEIRKHLDQYPFKINKPYEAEEDQTQEFSVQLDLQCNKEDGKKQEKKISNTEIAGINIVKIIGILEETVEDFNKLAEGEAKDNNLISKWHKDHLLVLTQAKELLKKNKF